ncbi:hypothetical protein, partial [Serratia marcescens]|uniref:hypothetical protein n=1 Tax=Serratia marcescens TaxID=615 RepID=UPI001954D02C
HMIPLDLAAETPTHPILFELADFARSIVDGSCRPYRRLAEASAELDEIAEAADVARRDTQALLQSIEV